MRMRLWRVMLGIALSAVVWAGANRHQAAAAGAAPSSKVAALPQMPAPTGRDRVLAVAPHCDDETIGCGGYLAMATRAGAAVRVVEVTCGEGFSSAAQRLYGEKEVTREEYLGLAETRKGECLAAARDLGVKAEQVSFLGYPDRGLGDMWLRNWSDKQPYTSPYTGLSSTPSGDSEKRKAVYCGCSVLEDLKRTMEEFKPTMVLCPHPGDLHGDHWAVYCYTVGALYECGMLGRVTLRVYLVHQGSWPGVEEPNTPAPLAPPGTLTGPGWRWVSLPLGEGIRKQKEAALRKHVTQMQARGRYLLSYIRGNELFGVVDALVLPARAERIGDRTAPLQSGEEARLVRDAQGDELISDAPPGADLLAVRAESDGKRLSLRLELAQESAPDVEYQVDLHALTGRKVGPPESYRLKAGEHTRIVWCEARGREVAISLPWPPRAGEGIMLSVSTWLGKRVVDRTPWVVVRAGGEAR